MIVKHRDIKSLICNFQYGILWRNKVFAKHTLVFQLLPVTVYALPTSPYSDPSIHNIWIRCVFVFLSQRYDSSFQKVDMPAREVC